MPTAGDLLDKMAADNSERENGKVSISLLSGTCEEGSIYKGKNSSSEGT